jgi:hypothetical protein
MTNSLIFENNFHCKNRSVFVGTVLFGFLKTEITTNNIYIRVAVVTRSKFLMYPLSNYIYQNHFILLLIYSSENIYSKES